MTVILMMREQLFSRSRSARQVTRRRLESSALKLPRAQKTNPRTNLLVYTHY